MALEVAAADLALCAELGVKPSREPPQRILPKYPRVFAVAERLADVSVL